MILFTFYKKNGRRYFPISFEAADAERGIYRLLDGYVDTETAIDASSCAILPRWENPTSTRHLR